MRINFTSTSNTRDLGGLPLELGHWTKCNRILRSDVPISLENEELDYLIKNRINTIIDLRDKKHTELSPTCLQNNTDFTWHNIPLQRNVQSINSEDDLLNAYLDFCENIQEMKAIFRIISKEENGVLIHCQEGKDRTGVVIAILLLTAGVPFEDIVIDYSCTQVYMKKYIDNIFTTFPDFPEYNYATKACYADKFILKFLEKYRSAPDYLHYIGLTEDEIESVKTKLS